MKNRFGGTDEIGVFAMEGAGLSEVPNPSALFLSVAASRSAAPALFPAMEGSGQYLRVPGAGGEARDGATPRRAAVASGTAGWR